MHIGLIGSPSLWDDIIVKEILNLMLQTRILIGTMPYLLMEKVIQIHIPILWERVEIWSWIQRFEMTSLAHMLKNFGYGCSQWIKVPLGLKTLSWVWVCILVLILKRTLILILIWSNNIDIGLNIRRFARTSKNFLGSNRDPSLSFVKLPIVYSIINSYPTIA